MLVRDIESGLLNVLEEEGMGCIVFSPLAQGLLTGKYLDGIPEGSRANLSYGFLQKEEITDRLVGKLRRLHELARARPAPGPASPGLGAARCARHLRAGGDEQRPTAGRPYRSAE